MMIKISLGLTAGRPLAQTGPGPAPFASAVLNEIARDMAVFDSGFHRGLSHAAVPLSGLTSAADGAVIEVRFVDADTGTWTTSWTALGTASGGLFIGQAQAPRAPCWYRAEVRVQGSSAPAAQMANRLAAGHVWSVWEQSNWAKLLEIPGSTAGLYDPITYPGDVQITARGATLGQIVPVTEANKGTAPVSPAMVTFANAWAALRGREKLLLVMQTKSGTGITDALTRDPGESPTGTRDWDEDKAIHTAATDIGTPVGAVFVPGWEEAHIGVGAAIPGNFMETFTGHNAAGVKVDLAAVWGGVPRLPVRKLADGSTTLLKSGVPFNLSDPTDGGLYDMTYSKVGYFGPHGNNLSLPVASTYPTLASMPSYDTLPEATKFAAIVDAGKATWVSANHSEVLDYPGANIGAYRALTDTLHYDGDDRDGRQRHAALGLFFMTKMLGMHSYPVPALDARHDDPAGAYSDFAITGRNLTTERLRRAAAGTLGGIPATIPAIAPHRCEVMGWCINKRPVLADIQTASGHPVFPHGQSFCRVYANAGAPITAVSEVRYGYGVWPGHLVQEDYDDRVYLNWLVCDVGQPHAVLPAVPVQFQQNVGLPTTLPVTELFKVAGTTHLRSLANATPPGTTAYFEARLRVDAFSAAGMELMGLGSDAFVLVNADGSVSLSGTGSSAALAPAGTLSLGVFRTLGFVVDRTVGSAKLEIVDASTGAVLATQTTVATGAFSGGRVNFFFRGGSGNALFNGTFEYARIWQNTSAPSGNPAHAIEAIAGAPHYAVPFGALQLASSGPVAPLDGTA